MESELPVPPQGLNEAAEEIPLKSMQASESQHGFRRALGLALLLNALVKPAFILLVDAQVQARLGPVLYGRYYLVYVATLLPIGLLDLGLANWLTRSLAANSENETNLLRSAIRLRLITAGLYAIAALVITAFQGGLADGADAGTLTILAGLLVYQLGLSALQLTRAVIVGRQGFVSDAWLGVLDRALALGLGLVFLHAVDGFAWDAWHLAWLQGVAVLVALGVGVALLRAKGSSSSPNSAKSQILNSTSRSAFAWRSALPFAGLALLMSAYMRGDALLLGWLSGEGAVGSYGSAYRLIDAASMLPLTVAGMLLPRFARMMSEESPEGLDNQALKRFRKRMAWALGGAGAAIAVVVLAWEIWANVVNFGTYPSPINLTYGSKDYLAVFLPFAFLILSYPAICLNGIYGTYLTAALQMRGLLTIAGWALVGMVVGNLVWARFFQSGWGIESSIQATMRTACISMLVQWGVCIAQYVAVRRLG